MYKVISIISGDAEFIIEEYSDSKEAEDRLKELEETNDDYMEMKSSAFIIKGDIIKHNIKNITKFEL